MIARGASSFSNMMNMSFGNRSLTSKGHLMDSDEEVDSDDNSYRVSNNHPPTPRTPRRKSDEESDNEQRGRRFGFRRFRKTGNDSSGKLHYSPPSSPRQSPRRTQSESISTATADKSAAAQLVFVQKEQKSESFEPPRRAKSADGMMGMMFMSDMKGGEVLLQMQCAASKAAPKPAKSKKQKNKDILEAYNAKIAAKKAAKKAQKAVTETFNNTAGEGGSKQQRIKIRVRVPKGSDPAVVAAMAQKSGDLHVQSGTSSDEDGCATDDSKEKGAVKGIPVRSIKKGPNSSSHERNAHPHTPKTLTRQLVTSTFSNAKGHIQTPKTSRTPRQTSRSPHTPSRGHHSPANKASDSESMQKTTISADSILKLCGGITIDATTLPPELQSEEVVQQQSDSVDETATKLTTSPVTPPNQSENDNHQQPVVTKNILPNQSSPKSPIRRKLRQSKSVRKLIAKKEAHLLTTTTPLKRSKSLRRPAARKGENIEKEPQSSPALRRQRSSRSRSNGASTSHKPGKERETEISSPPTSLRRQKSFRSRSRGTGSNDGNGDESPNSVGRRSPAEVEAAPVTPRQRRRQISTRHGGHASKLTKTPMGQKRRVDTTSFRRLQTDEAGYDAMKASASIACATVATQDVSVSSSAPPYLRSPARRAFREAPLRRRTEIAPGTPRKRPQKTESLLSVQARIKELDLA